MTADRDRDATGRARNARPRDASGRPLARGAVGRERTDDSTSEPDAALAEAERLLRADEPFAAHDVLEAVWKAQRALGAADTQRWQGLAQLAVGLTHLQRGNVIGAARLLERGAGNIGPGDLRAWALRLAAAVADGEQVAAAELTGCRPSLRDGL